MLLDLTGLPWPVIALKAGVQPRLVHRLLFPHSGRRLLKLPRDSALRLFMLTNESLAELERTWVPAEETHVHLAELLADGYSPSDLARYCRLSRSQLLATLSAPSCTELTALLASSARMQCQSRPGQSGQR
jgi:hypothetical protein